ncbi:KpsF/GutQ family sugar-phosphate isomerase [Aurantiacibacter gangjinensis]|uniref:D-arabinose 5-phosphate n=1 Tax=Aurantiacibacter gangjinensis TaxID=502682 RepID=A0A0G9MML2_9SPHN|nr:KpsF/GutQ family sugar-phosphate isomerase [Aurantiacibacter gangjinensis]APE27885.1 Arabinose 5-phosphate isomerase [Aurantiacibacter gangjinensis]KLE31849.1 D-arabinose 5-phosphate [Aurantiacibacter gangjinensis]
MNDTSSISPAHHGANVIRIESAALAQMADALGDEFDAAATLLRDCKGRVVVSGMGKSGHIGNKIAATLASTGTPSFFVHPSEASHGDLGMITRDDVCLVLSNSGETAELHALLAYVARFDIPMIAITKKADSTLARQAEVALLLPQAEEACSVGMAPTTSTTCTLALGDALAVAVMRMRGFRKEDFHVFHPGGKLGAQFLRVGDIMHTGDAVPAVRAGDSMGDVLVEMSAKGLGVAAVLEDGKLLGVITDGDLRRNMDGLLDRDAGSTATKKPMTIAPSCLVEEAMALMSGNKVSALPVVDEDGTLAGVVHVHDCLRAGAR